MTRDAKHRHDTAHVGHVPVAQLGALTWKKAVRAATTATGTLATAFENGDTIDGVVLATGDRILLKNQTTGQNNGIYVVNASGAPTRAEDFDASDEIMGALVFVIAGTANAGKLFRNTNTSAPTIGTTPLTFSEFSAAGLLVQDGLRARLVSGVAAFSQTDTGTTADIQLGATNGFIALVASNSISFTVGVAGKHAFNDGLGLILPILSADPDAGDSEEGQIYFNDSDQMVRWYDGTDWQDVGGSGSGPDLSDDTPLVESGSGDPGVSTDASRSDHVHPADGGVGGGGAAELDYVEKTSNTTITGTNEAGGNTAISSTSLAYDGSTEVEITVFIPEVSIVGAAGVCVIDLWEDSTPIGRLATPSVGVTTADFRVPVHATRRRTPSNASHQYHVKAWKATAGAPTMSIDAGAGGTGALVPAFIKIVTVP